MAPKKKRVSMPAARAQSRPKAVVAGETKAGGRMKPAPAAAIAASAVQAPVPAAVSKNRKWFQILIAAIVVLVSAEAFIIVKSKIERQYDFHVIRTIGWRGGPPDVEGKFWGPGGILIDDKFNRVAMIDPCFYKILIWDLNTGAHIIDLDLTGVHKPDPKGQPLKKGFVPAGGGFDAVGNLYVADFEKPEVTVFSPEYKIINTFKTISAKNIAVAPTGQFYLCDKTSVELVKYNSAGQEVGRFGSDILISPGVMACDESGNVYVVDIGSKKIVAFSPDGKMIGAIAPKFQPFKQPSVAVKRGKIYVSEPENKLIMVYTAADKKFIEEANAYWPAVINVDAKGLVYVDGASGIDQGRMSKKRDR